MHFFFSFHNPTANKLSAPCDITICSRLFAYRLQNIKGCCFDWWRKVHWYGDTQLEQEEAAMDLWDGAPWGPLLQRNQALIMLVSFWTLDKSGPWMLSLRGISGHFQTIMACRKTSVSWIWLSLWYSKRERYWLAVAHLQENHFNLQDYSIWLNILCTNETPFVRFPESKSNGKRKGLLSNIH